MARPLSETKRTALLAAAVDAIAASGPGASTLNIAKNAGVGEGTLFVYFATKDELLTQVFIELKTDLQKYVADNYPVRATVKKRFAHIWEQRIEWGLENPAKEQAMRRLSVSEKLLKAKYDFQRRDCQDVGQMFEEGFKSGVLRKQPVTFLVSTVDKLAEMVLEMCATEPTRFAEFKELGWKALWSSIAADKK